MRNHVEIQQPAELYSNRSDRQKIANLKTSLRMVQSDQTASPLDVQRESQRLQQLINNIQNQNHQTN